MNEKKIAKHIQDEKERLIIEKTMKNMETQDKL